MGCSSEEGGAGFRFDPSALPKKSAASAAPPKEQPQSSFKLGDAVKIDGLKNRADLNGQWGVCQGDFDEASGRIEVVTSSGETVAMKPSTLWHSPLLKGTPVRVIGLQSKPELNGQVARVVELQDPESGRWMVELADGTAMKLQPKNIVRVH
eukprot:TRINITY_DN8422_c0_g1_i1.p1 TRINITY_DN8422_c0_g1~~TRINITY_DN8422_c0_g1_i1.p1  ORF type:complete len:152 (+),score=48.29 TRINITY_DN8422_c0_g1_i1:72-527(+)